MVAENFHLVLREVCDLFLGLVLFRVVAVVNFNQREVEVVGDKFHIFRAGLVFLDHYYVGDALFHVEVLVLLYERV